MSKSKVVRLQAREVGYGGENAIEVYVSHNKDRKEYRVYINPITIAQRNGYSTISMELFKSTSYALVRGVTRFNQKVLDSLNPFNDPYTLDQINEVAKLVGMELAIDDKGEWVRI
jgi:hypothetical protein